MNKEVRKLSTVKNLVGRPTSYREELNDELDKYLATTGKEQCSLPTVQGFSLWVKVNDDTLVEWAKVHPTFTVTLRRLKTVQAEQLINDGIYGGKEVNPTIVKLMLMNNHGMRERNDVTSGDDKIEAPILYIPGEVE